MSNIIKAADHAITDYNDIAVGDTVVVTSPYGGSRYGYAYVATVTERGETSFTVSVQGGKHVRELPAQLPIPGAPLPSPYERPRRPRHSAVLRYSDEVKQWIANRETIASADELRGDVVSLTNLFHTAKHGETTVEYIDALSRKMDRLRTIEAELERVGSIEMK